MALQKLMGQNFRVTEGSGVINEAVSCQVAITTSVEDASTKDTQSGYAKSQMMSRGWNVQVDMFDVAVATLRTWITRFNSQAVDSSGTTEFYVGWDQTSGTDNRTTENAAIQRSGQAWLTDFSLQANNRQTCRLSLQFTGNGALS